MNLLTRIFYIRRKKISLLPIFQASKPPILIVFVQYLDGITTANSQFIRAIRFVIVKRNNLGKEQRSRTVEVTGKARSEA